ncbi:MAG TPA: hypothetical protein VES40_10765 [Ilumatobacteraceae bacterium]|nr:hypothetical protein [Ilumatobacteraceae bacterium]
MTVLVHTDLPTADAVHAASYTRGIEVEALLQAVTALHRDGILTDTEYETKRQRLANATTR